MLLDILILCMLIMIKSVPKTNFILLFKVLYSRGEHFDVVITGNIFVKTISDSFAMSHFTEYSAVGRCDTFDSKVGTVRIEIYIKCRISDVILVRTILDWCLPILLKVSVGEFASVSVILP